MTFSPICRPWDGNTSTLPAITSGHPICRKPSTDCEPCVPPPPTFSKLPNVLVLSAYATISHEPLVPALLEKSRAAAPGMLADAGRRLSALKALLVWIVLMSALWLLLGAGGYTLIGTGGKRDPPPT